MKVLRRAKIYADTEIKDPIDPGTVFYHITEDQLSACADRSDNAIFQYMVDTYGLDAINTESNLYGSRIIDGDLYLCETDDKYIQVHGERVNPEHALDYFSVDELSDYIEEVDDEKLDKLLDGRELVEFDLDDVAEKMFQEGYSLEDITKAATKLRLFR